jgi:hypothetical protein
MSTSQFEKAKRETAREFHHGLDNDEQRRVGCQPHHRRLIVVGVVVKSKKQKQRSKTRE